MWVTNQSCLKWTFQAKIQCKNKGFELKLTQDGGTVQCIIFPGIKINP